MVSTPRPSALLCANWGGQKIDGSSHRGIGLTVAERYHTVLREHIALGFYDGGSQAQRFAETADGIGAGAAAGSGVQPLQAPRDHGRCRRGNRGRWKSTSDN